MTRKTAIQEAIQILSSCEQNKEIIEKLQDIYDELPIVNWSDKSIVDSVEQFILDNNRVPTAVDFKRRGLPPHPVVFRHYNMTLSEWLNINYPTRKPTREEIKKKYTDDFIRDYNLIKPHSQIEFETNKSRETKCWITIASYYNVSSWHKLIEILKLPVYTKQQQKQCIKVKIHSDYNFNESN